MIQKDLGNDYLSRINAALTSVRGVNKTDVKTLGDRWGVLFCLAALCCCCRCCCRRCIVVLLFCLPAREAPACPLAASLACPCLQVWLCGRHLQGFC